MLRGKARFLVAFLAVALVVAGLPGCTKGGSTGGGTFICAQPLDPTGLDPALGTDAAAINIETFIYDTLVMYAPGDQLKLTGGLAETWDISPDGLTYTFHLRKNVKFHDGTPFNADAVKFNLDRELDPNNKYHTAEMTFAPTLLALLDRWRVVDEYTFEMTLKKPFSGFIDQLTSTAAGGIASPAAIEKYGADYFKNPVGTGPFKFVEWKKDTEIDFVANKDYWGGSPKVSKLVVRTIPESATILAELRTGGVHFVIYGLNDNDLELAAQDPNLTVKSLPALSSYILHFRSWKKPFNDLRLRQAVAYAINKENIAKYVLKGHAAPATGVMPKASAFYLQDDPYPYNPDKAKELLAAAGYAKGLTVDLLTNPHMTPATEAIQADLAKVGITANLKRTEGGAFWDQLPTDVGDMIMDNWWLPNGDPDYLLGAMFHTRNIETKSNVDRYSNKDVDALLDQGVVETDPAKRADIYNQIQTLVAKDVPNVPIYYLDNMYAYNNKAEGILFHPIGYYFWNVSIAK